MTPEELQRKKARFIKNCWAQKYKYEDLVIETFIETYEKEKNGTMLYLPYKDFNIGKAMYPFNLMVTW